MSELETSGLERLKHLIPIGVVAVFVTAVIIIVTGIVLSVSGLISSESIRKEMVSSAPELDKIKKKDIKILNTYKWVNKDSGTVRIPVQRAMELMIIESKMQPDTVDE